MEPTERKRLATKELASAEDIARWEGEGGHPSGIKAAPAEKGVLSAVHIKPQNLVIAGLSNVAIRQLISKHEYITTKPTRDYAGVELISVPGKTTLVHALRILAKHRISCVPVMMEDVRTAPKGVGSEVLGEEPTDKSTGPITNTFSGFVDALDICSYFIERTSKTATPDDKSLLDTEVKTLIDKSHKDAVYPFHEGFASSSLIDLFAKGIHRVPVFDDAKRIVGLCSQYDLVCSVSSLFEKGDASAVGLEPLSEYTKLFHTQWSPERVVWIPNDSTVQQALTKMAFTGLSSVAITDKDGSLVGQARAEDVMRTVPDMTMTLSAWLALPIMQLLEEESQEITQPMFELPTLSLAAACKMMSDNHVHHIWIVKDFESMAPVGIFTLTDVCRIIRDVQTQIG